MRKKIITTTLLCIGIILTGCNTNFNSSVKKYTVNGVEFNMISVEGGTFTMGSTESTKDAEADEYPAHSVTISDFQIGETEVTQELWTAVMGKNPSGYNNDPQLPVESMNWFEAQSFIEKLNQLTGEQFRMPTEAEWEYAARGGNKSKGYLYSGSDTLSNVGWYKDNAEECPKPVKTKQPNELGLYDMSGNLWEWCSDWYGKYTPEESIDPQGPTEGHSRVLRGGSWLIDAPLCRPEDRSFGAPKGGGCIVGMRLAI